MRDARPDDEKALVDELRAGGKLYRAIFDASPAGITIVTLEGLRFLDVNPALCRMVGYAREELLAKTIPEITHPGDAELDSRAVARRNEGDGSPLDYEKRLVHKDGHPVWVRLYSIPLEFAAGRPTIILGVVLDITREKLSEQESRESRLRLDLVARSSRIGMWDWSIQTGDLKVDEIWADMLGYTLGELEPVDVRTFFDALHPDDLKVSREALDDHLQGSTEFYECQLRFRHKGGSWIWILARGKVFERDEVGNPVRMLGTHMDITHLKQVELRNQEFDRQFLQTQKLESLGVLAGGIAHDFNNILTVIQGHADLASTLIPEHSPGRNSLRQITSAVRQAGDLCAQMLAYSGRGNFLIEPIDLNALLGDIQQLLRTSISKKTQLEFDLQGPVGRFRGDATQVRQVILNLVLNASEAMEETGGRIVVGAGTREFSRSELDTDFHAETLEPGVFTFLRVVDEGPGMDEQTRERAFEPFFTTRFTGRGLGLSAVLGIVRSHRGALRLETEPGRGAAFTLIFPVLNEEKTEAEDLSLPVSGSVNSPMTLLLVEDESMVLDLAAGMLERLGVSTIPAADGRRAMAAYREHRDRIDGVLLDLTMPVMDGEETFMELRRLDPRLPIVICSGYSEKEVERRFFGKGLTGFLSKPYSLASLRDVLLPAVRNTGEGRKG
ncbi:PAS domain-containing protein [bacterium]|nr:PAS domain-containing protein [bacterium]